MNVFMFSFFLALFHNALLLSDVGSDWALSKGLNSLLCASTLTQSPIEKILVVTSSCSDRFVLGMQEAAWAVSMIAAGTMLHKQIVFQGGAIPSLLHLLATAAFDVRKEAAYALGNVCVAPKENGKDGIEPIVQHLTVLVDRGCIPGFLALVKSPDMEAAKLGLHFLELVSVVLLSLKCFIMFSQSFFGSSSGVFSASV